MEQQLKIGEKLAELRVLAPAGYALGLHFSFTTTTFMFQTYPQKWRDEYAENGFVLQDPSVRWGFENTGAITWSELAATDEYGIFKRAAAHGILFGTSVAVEADGSKSLGGYARSDRTFTTKEEARLIQLTQDLHDMTAKIRSLSAETTRALKNLSINVTNKGR